MSVLRCICKTPGASPASRDFCGPAVFTNRLAVHRDAVQGLAVMDCPLLGRWEKHWDGGKPLR